MFISAVKENEDVYSLYTFEETFDMLRDEKDLLPDFSLLTDVSEDMDETIGGCRKDPDFYDEFMDCQNVDNFTKTTIDTNGLGICSTIDVASTSVDKETPQNIAPPSETGNFTHDEKTVAAVLASLESKSMTPLIKEGLRSIIQTKRLKEGKQELEVRFTPYVKREPQTEDEINRAMKRKEQNKMAARRFRQRQKDFGDRFMKKIKKIEAANTVLRKEIQQLQNDKSELSLILQNHLSVCHYQPDVSLP
ncbi:hypothetical protein LOTGIDRAFT_233904 [Lottia gigantea]|uniref:BZIP domain-containing protein n=1 Tax=Lottia gigantea TaxID=225164 RepID=V4BMG1_LOTGI|nr:hypothetical protein LOTGIDRAFT_233904 [Lottia gigantea]ESO90094.1 hypothetical protein LOTGIDRAFT_233904 [Lottia gigantea]